MPNTIHITNGLILDPFSIHATGIMRAHVGVKNIMAPIGGKIKLFDGLHGETRFKQAFVNCCHFAESMTVVGPVAQLVWDKSSPSVIENALRWQAVMSDYGNGDVFRQFEEYCRSHNWTNIPDETWKSEEAYLLNMLPDLSLKNNLLIGDEAWMTIHDNVLDRFLYDSRYGGASLVRDTARVNGLSCTDALVQRGLPVLGLMAVTFTFKKPIGLMGTVELVNLGGWPPVTFLIPTLLPARATIQDQSVGDGGMFSRITKRQPAVSSYRISIGVNGGNTTIVPFCQPYRLTSVPKEGKRPDILRSLSDVFKALWSQAAQYSAWNMSIPWQAADENGEAVQKHIGDMSLDPLGAGRRIRGHNRHMSKYGVDNFSMIWEDHKDERLVGWNLKSADKGAWNCQMRSGRSGAKENIFVLPSYFTEQTGANLYPVALALARFGMIPEAGIEDFLDGGILASVEPVNHLDKSSEMGCRKQSFVDLMTEAAQGISKDPSNRGAIPVHRVEAEISFDIDGDPTVFGLRMSHRAQQLMWQHDDAPLNSDDRGELSKEVHRLGNFQFLDAICSKNTKDLTDTFKAVKAKGVSKPGTKAAALLDDELAIDLFGSESMDGMLE